MQESTIGSRGTDIELGGGAPNWAPWLLLAFALLAASFWPQALAHGGSYAFYFTAAAAMAGLAAKAFPGLGHAQPLEWRRWDTAALAALALLGAFACFWRLSDLVPVANEYEGDLAISIAELGRRPYRAYDVGLPFWNLWPTLHHYQTYLATRIFGWQPAVLRSVSAFYGALAVPALYLLGRRYLGRVPALAAAVLLALNPLQLLLARRLYPVSPLVFFAVVAAYFLLKAFESGRARHHALAGLAAGLMLNYYHAGKVALLLFPLWYALAFMAGGVPLRPRHLAAFAGAFFVAFAPLLFNEVVHPGEYFAWIKGIDPGKRESLAQRLADLWRAAPSYLGIWAKAGSAHIEDGPAGMPVMLPLAAGFGLAGLAAAVPLLRRPLPLALLLLFGMGLLPALPGGHVPHPCTRRAILAVPALCLGAGFALQLLMLGAQRLLPTLASWSALGLAGTLGLLSGGYAWLFIQGHGANTVFQCYMGGYEQFLAGRSVREFPAPKVQMDAVFMERKTQWRFYLPLGTGISVVRGLEEALAAEAGPRYLALSPYLWAAGGLLKQVPGAQVTLRPWSHTLAKAGIPYYRDFFTAEMGAGVMLEARLPEAGLQSLRGLRGVTGDVVPAFGPGYLEGLAPGQVQLTGWLWMARPLAPLTVEVALPGAEVSLDGGPWRRRAELAEAAGPLALRVRFKAGTGQRGPLPLKAMHGSADLLAGGRVLALPAFSPWKVGWLPGLGIGEPAKPAVRWSGRTPVAAYNPNYPNAPVPVGLSFPFRLVLQSELTAPRDGLYRFAYLSGLGRISIDGVQAYSDGPLIESPASSRPVALRKGQRFRLVAEAYVHPHRYNHQSVALGWKPEGGGQLIPVPWEWQRKRAEVAQR